MKLWQKLYVVLIIPILLILNIAIYLLFGITYKENIAAEKKQAVGDFGMIIDQIYGEMQQSQLNDKDVKNIIQKYTNYYKQQKIELGLWQGEKKKKIYYSDKAHFNTKKNSIKNNKVIKCYIDGHTRLMVFKLQKCQKKTFYFGYEKTLYNLDSMWKNIRIYYAIGSLVISIIMALFMIVVLQKCIKPVENLNETVKKMAGGELETRTDIKGSDELAVLGKNINIMAETIENNMKQIMDEAERKQWFIDNLAHEMKTPVTGICGFVEYMERAKISDEEKMECLGFIGHEAKRLQNMSYELLDLAVIRHSDIKKQNISMNKFTDELKKWQEKRFAEKNIKAEWEIKADRLFGDELLLEMLIRNIFENAFRATDEGGKISTYVYENEKNTVFEITDTGCGMEPEELEKIKEPFYRVDKSRSRKQGGTGLGVSLCQKIVEKHDGSMEYRSKNGVGTTVTVKIPL